MTSETVSARHVERGTRAEIDIPRSDWSPPRLRRMATSSAEGASGIGPDAELIS